MNTLAAYLFNAKLAQANLIIETYFDSKLLSLNRKITTNKWKHLLVENEFKKLKTFDWSYFIGKSHFEEDGTQNCLVLLVIVNDNYWKSKRLPDEKINSIKTRNHRITRNINYYGNKTRVEFNVAV